MIESRNTLGASQHSPESPSGKNYMKAERNQRLNVKLSTATREDDGGGSVTRVCV